MKIPFSWLQSFFSDKLTPSDVAISLTRAGLEIENVKKPKEFGKHFVVGIIEETKKHPDADRLTVCKVRVKKNEIRTIVCGAPNVAQGQHVAVVLPGGSLPDGTAISETDIRGVLSQGMICSPDELGLTGGHEGIIILDPSIRLGSKLDSVGLHDTVLEAEVTANRPDWLSIRGVARELSAVLHTTMTDVPYTVSERILKSAPALKVKIMKGAASEYLLRRIESIQNHATPSWMINRLHAVGLKSQGALIDITNYVLYEFGAPIHAFDADRISGKTIYVRFARPKELITLLDGTIITLNPKDIVIADSKGPIALAGVMGGDRAAVTKTTKRILIEAAVFPARHIRHTSRMHGIRTDAANRFERGIYPSLPREAIDRAARLYQEICGAKIPKGILGSEGRHNAHARIITEVKGVNELLGTHFTPVQMKSYLIRLGFQVKLKRATLDVTPPLYRHDVRIVSDVAEEIGRIHGLYRLTPSKPTIRQRVPERDEMITLMRRTARYAAEKGYTELFLQSMYSQNELFFSTMPPSEHRELVNPVDAEARLLRADLLPNMLRALEHERKNNSQIRFFEIGQVFWKAMKPGQHEWRLALAVSSHDGGSLIQLQQDLLDLLSHLLHIQKTRIHFGQGKQFMDVKIDVIPVGLIALRALRKGIVAATCECSLSELAAFLRPEKYVPIGKFPSVSRDIALVVPLHLDFVTLMRQIFRASSLVKDVQLFDALPQSETMVSYAYHIYFQSDQKTLSAQEIEFEMLAIERAVQQKGGMIRV